MTITVRALEPCDYEALHSVLTGEEAVKGTLLLPFRSLEQTRARYAEAARNSYQLVGCIDGEVVGTISLEMQEHPRRRHVGHLGMVIRDDMRGRGIGTALLREAVDLADNWLNLLRLELEVWTDNQRAIRLYRKFDFVVEGTHRCWAYRDGQMIDAHVMARVRGL
jgi:putative acetyltransferase